VELSCEILFVVDQEQHPPKQSVSSREIGDTCRAREVRRNPVGNLPVLMQLLPGDDAIQAAACAGYTVKETLT